MPRALLYYLAQAWTADRHWQAQRGAPARPASRARHSRPSLRTLRARGLPAAMARRLRRAGRPQSMTGMPPPSHPIVPDTQWKRGDPRARDSR